MRKHYAFNFLKDNLPLIITMFIAIFLIGFVPAATAVKVSHYSDNYYVQDNFSILTIVVPIILSTILFATKTFSFRHTKEAADMYMSLPFKEREIKWIRMIVFLIAITLIYTITYFSSVTIYYFKAVEKYNYAHEEFNVKYAYFIPIYFFGLIATISTYLINCVFANLANRGGRAFLYVLMGQIVLGCLILLPLIFYMNEIVGEEETAFSKWLGNLDQTTFSYSFVTPLAFIQNFYKIKLVGVEQAEVAKAYYLPFIIYNVLGLGSGALMVLLRDPSGEYAGDRKNRNKFFSTIVHLAFLSLLFLPLTSLDALVIIIYVLCITLYYILLSVLGGSFKLNKMDFFTMLTVDVAYIAMFILIIAA